MQDFVVLKTQAKVRKNLINLIKSGRRRAHQIGKISVVSQSFGEIISKKQRQSDQSQLFEQNDSKDCGSTSFAGSCYFLLFHSCSSWWTIVSAQAAQTGQWAHMCHRFRCSSALLSNASASADTATTQVCSCYHVVHGAMDRYLSLEQLLSSV